jgi:hypothetical protein
MPNLDLRPLTIGEVLDRTFTLYRTNFLLFIGIAAVPQLLVLALSLAVLQLPAAPRGPLGLPDIRYYLTLPFLSAGLLALVVLIVANLFSQGATILAVADLYLGRPATIVESLRRTWGELGTLFGIALLSGLAIGFGALFLIFPGVYLYCRLMVAAPVAMIEQRGVFDSLSRSFRLTQSNAGRAFLITLLFMVISLAMSMLFGAPFGILSVVYRADPFLIKTFSALNTIASSVSAILIKPIILIAISVFYFDLRVRKEGFDLQFMMDPNSERRTPGGTGSVPSILS